MKAFNEILDNMKSFTDFDFEIENNNQKIKYFKKLKIGYKTKDELVDINQQITILKKRTK